MAAPLPMLDYSPSAAHINNMNYQEQLYRNVPRAVRMILLLGLSVQTIAVGAFLVMGTGLFLLDAITLSFNYWSPLAWVLWGAMAAFVLANTHLIARLINKWPERYKRRSLDILASLPSIAFPGWACISLILDGNWDLGNALFYGVPTAFNIAVLCFATLPPLRRHFFEYTTMKTGNDTPIH
ncbi:hypothetical protein [Pseudodesulfovibrio hydrargyri]|uniref:hypothetical protein n=1 Tax=Pseudodesulfovibrio hydrargyri TaxID=2125990 RepID=UPI00101AECE1|nr:hypothetical protein [Pseudodesulfovibrio hydrargyri]